MIIGTYDEDGVTLDADECICKYGALADILCASPDTHISVYLNKKVTVTGMTSAKYLCPRKTWWEYNQRIYVFYKDIFSVLRGKLFHRELLKELPYKEITLLSSVDGLEFSGTPDGYDPCTKTLYELKSVYKLPKKFKERDAKQCDIYTYLLEWHGKTVDKYELWYITFRDYTKFEIPKRSISTNEIKDMIRLVLDHMVEEKGEPVEEWACGYCFYHYECPIGYDLVVRTKKVKAFVRPAKLAPPLVPRPLPVPKPKK